MSFLLLQDGTSKLLLQNGTDSLLLQMTDGGGTANPYYYYQNQGGRMSGIWMDVDTALAEVPVNAFPLIDDTDFKTIETSVAYNATGMTLYWNFVTTAGAHTSTAVTPTTAGTYDWAHQNGGMYTIEIPASGGASINNDTEGFGWFSGVATGVCPWRGPTIGFRAAALNDALIDGGDNLDVNVAQWLGTAPATPTVAGVPKVDPTHLLGTALTETSSGYLAAGLKKLLDVATPVFTLASVNQAGDAYTYLTTNLGLLGASLSAIPKTGFKLASDGLAAVTAWTVNITGALSGSVGSVTGNVGGNVTGSVGSLATQTKTDVSTAVHLCSSVTYGLTLTTMGRLLHNGGAAAFDGTVTGTPSSTAIELSTSPDAPSATDDFYNDMVAYVDSSTGAGQARPILDYNGTTKIITFDEALAVVPSAGDRIVIRASHVHPKTQAAVAVRTEMDSNSTQLAAIVEDTAEIGTAGAGLTEAGGTGDHLTALPWNASWDTEVQSEVADALAVYDPPTRTEATTDKDAILTRLGTPADTDVSTDIAAVKAGTLTAAAKAKIDRSAIGICTGTVGVGSTTTSIVTSALSPAGGVADQFKGRIVIFDDSTTTAALRGQATDITASSNAALAVLTVTALTTAPASTDTFTIT